eukprot:GHVS01084857.1.p1 GENE.GHVS01084857.1~~GHVS01084857.1.p1  ORF type:complete len:407 (+),score=104.51 GHVS01084857.1:252-1472(+)
MHISPTTSSNNNAFSGSNAQSAVAAAKMPSTTTTTSMATPSSSCSTPSSSSPIHTAGSSPHRTYCYRVPVLSSLLSFPRPRLLPTSYFCGTPPPPRCCPSLLSLLLLFSLLPCCMARPDYCRNARLPAATFAAQGNHNRVYSRVDDIDDQAFISAGLTKFVTVFGVRIVASPSVPDAKLLHTMRVMAKMLDNDEDGRPQNPTLINTLYRRSATLGFVQTDSEMNRVFEWLPKEYACFLFLVLELESNINVNGQPEDDCPHNLMSIGSRGQRSSRGRGDDGGFDRSIGLVGDFLIQSGYPTIYPSDSELGVLVESAFVRSKRREWFSPNSARSNSNRRCDVDCQRVSFQSWALSSALGVDACSCRKVGAWKLCTPQEMRRADPTLFSAILEDMEVPTGRYYSTAIVH